MLRRMPKFPLLLLLPLTVAACGGGGGDEGYKDPGRLAATLKTKAQARMDKNPGMYNHARVTDTKCVQKDGLVYRCSGEISSGERWTINVTVSKDGLTYVSDGNQ